jgi:glutaredoxin-related protein
MAGISDLYRMLPVNSRVFLETMLGDKSPITEKDFSEKDLEFYRAEYDKKKAKNESDEASLRSELAERLESPDRVLGSIKGSDELQDITPKIIRDLENKIKSYEDTRNKTSMSPRDYASKDYVHEGGWAGSIIRSFTDPSYRAGTTLGQFNVIQQEDGNVSIQDTYNWTKAPKTISLGEFVGSVKAVKSPEQLGNLFMRLLKPGTNREVNIKLPEKKKQGGSVVERNPYANYQSKAI